MPRIRKISSVVLAHTALLSVLGVFILGGLWLGASLVNSGAGAARLRQERLEASKAAARAEVAEVLAQVQALRSGLAPGLRPDDRPGVPADAEADLQQKVLMQLETMHFGDGGALFVGTAAGVALLGPARGRDLSGLADAAGVRVVQEFVRAARSGGGFVEYSLPAVAGVAPSRRMSYAALVEGWDWCVAAGVDLDHVEAEVARRPEGLWPGMRGQILTALLVLGALGAAQLFLARRMAVRLGAELACCADFFRQAAERPEVLDPGVLGFAELTELAASANALVQGRTCAENALREREIRYRRLVDNASDAILLMAPDGRIVDVNRVACERLGYTRDELLDLEVGDVDMTVAEGCFREVLNALGPEQSMAVNATYRRKDGTTFPVEIVATAIEEDGQRYVLGLARDIGRRREAERELLKAKAAAESASRAKSQFLANMSHELRTPLNAIMGMTRILRNSPCTGEQAEFLETIQCSSEHLLRIIADVLDLSGIEAGRLRVAREPFRLRQTLTPLLKSCSVQAWQKGLAFEWSVAEDAPEHLAGDPGRLSQVLYNLAHNALKFTEQGRIEVRVALDEALAGDRVRLAFTVRDTGPGIPLERQQDVFERFVQGEDTPTRRHGGAGLGLAISRELAEMMGGELRVQSEVGQGSVFTFTVVADLAGKKPALRTGSAPARPEAPQPRRVLLVEDEAVNRLMAGRMLRMAGHQVAEAVDGQEALDILGREAFDVVLMDVQMPGLNGLDATRRIRGGDVLGCDPRIPIIAFTAYAQEEDRQSCLAAGMDDFASKPLDIDGLLDKIERVAAARK